MQILNNMNKPDKIKILTWNVNSIRVRIEQLEKLSKILNPDIICLQETKVKDYWHEKLKIKKDKIKTYVGCNGGRRLRNNYMGCASVRMYNIERRCKLEGIIDKYLNRTYNIESKYKK